MDNGKAQRQTHLETLSNELNQAASDYLKSSHYDPQNSGFISTEDLKNSLDKAVVKFMKDEVVAQVNLSGGNTPLKDFLKDVETLEGVKEIISRTRNEMVKDESDAVKNLLKNLDKLDKCCEDISNTIGDLSGKISDIKLKENFSWGDNIGRFAENMILKAVPKILASSAFFIAATVNLLAAIIEFMGLSMVGILAGTISGFAAGPVGAIVGGAAIGTAGFVAGSTLAYGHSIIGLMCGEQGSRVIMKGMDIICEQFRIDYLEKTENDKINISDAKVALEKFIEKSIKPQLLTDVANSIEASAKAAQANASRNM